MALRKITYTVGKKKYSVEAEICDTILKKASGLMFRRESPPLLFVFNKNKELSIHSLFCKPFRAIWLDDKMRATQVTDVEAWKLNISGDGKYLLELPAPLKNNKSPSRKAVIDNRNI